MSEFGVSELEWGAELPLSSLWKSCPWHAAPLKHSYEKIILTNLQQWLEAAVRASVGLQ